MGSMWQKLVEKLGGDKNRHFFLDQNDYCEICLEKKRKIEVRQGDEFRMLEKVMVEGRGKGFDMVNSRWLEEWENFVKGRTDKVPGKIPEAGGKTRVLKKLKDSLVGIYGIDKK